MTKVRERQHGKTRRYHRAVPTGDRMGTRDGLKKGTRENPRQTKEDEDVRLPQCRNISVQPFIQWMINKTELRVRHGIDERIRYPDEIVPFVRPIYSIATSLQDPDEGADGDNGGQDHKQRFGRAGRFQPWPVFRLLRLSTRGTSSHDSVTCVSRPPRAWSRRDPTIQN